MIEFIARRLLLLVPVLLLVSVISFSIIYISPGDTAENAIMNPGEELTGKPWRSSGLKQGLMNLYISSILTGWAEFSAETWESRT